MDAPSADTVKAASPLLAQQALTNEQIDALIAQAAPTVSMLTARNVGMGSDVGETPYGCPLEEVPESLEPLAVAAVARLSESVHNASSVKSRLRAGGVGLKSISAGPWSESYFGPEDYAKLRALDSDPMVAAGLWALATACAQAHWLRVWGVTSQEPAAAVQSFRYGERSPRW